MTGKYCKDKILSFKISVKQLAKIKSSEDNDKNAVSNVLQSMKVYVEDEMDGIWIDYDGGVKREDLELGSFFSYPMLREYHVSERHVKKLLETGYVKICPCYPSQKARKEFLYCGTV